MLPAHTEQEALVVVHLSDLDIFTWECGPEEGMRFARVLVDAITGYPGLIIVTNQRRPFSENSGPRKLVLAALRQHERVVTLAHDEEEDGWEVPMCQMRQTLHASGCRCVRVAGFEYHKDGASGCVLETQRPLEAQGMACRGDEALCG